MKHLKTIILSVSIAVAAFVSCEKDGEVGNLHGQWQLTQRALRGAPAEDCHTEGLFWNFQQHLVDIQSSKSLLNGVTNHTMGRFVFTGDSLRLTELYIHSFDRDSLLTDDALRTLVPAGIYGCRTGFAIETLTSKRMVLRNDSCQLVFRKFG